MSLLLAVVGFGALDDLEATVLPPLATLPIIVIWSGISASRTTLGATM